MVHVQSSCGPAGLHFSLQLKILGKSCNHDIFKGGELITDILRLANIASDRKYSEDRDLSCLCILLHLNPSLNWIILKYTISIWMCHCESGVARAYLLI